MEEDLEEDNTVYAVNDPLAPCPEQWQAEVWDQDSEVACTVEVLCQ